MRKKWRWRHRRGGKMPQGEGMLVERLKGNGDRGATPFVFYFGRRMALVMVSGGFHSFFEKRRGSRTRTK